MSLASIIKNMQTHLNDAYDALEEKGATIPEAKNLNNLATTVQSVPTDSGSGGEFNINGIIEEYYVYAGENISAGDFVNYIEGIANKTITPGVAVDTTETIINNLTRDYAYKAKALLLEDQKRILLTHSYSSDLYIVLLTVEDGVISIVSGTDSVLFSSQREWVSMVEVDTNKVLIAGTYSSAYNVIATTITVNDDNTLTRGSSVSISSACYSGTCDIQKIGKNKAFIVCGGKSGSSDAQAMVATIEDTVITLGEKVSLGTYTSCLSSVKVNDNQILVVLGCSTGGHIACYCNINDTTVTTSGAVNINTKPGSWITKTLLINPTTALYIFDDEEGDDWPLVGQFLYLDTNITYSDIFTIDTTQYSGNTLDAIQLSNGKIIINTGVYPDEGDCYMTVLVCEYTDNTLVELTRTRFSSPEYGDVTCQNTCSTYLFNNDDFGIVYDDGEGSLMATQIYSLNNETNLIVPIAYTTTVETTYETQVQKSKADVFNGIAKTSGAGGDEMGHNEKIEIYTL